ncbi:MAG: SusF/SusE family outer membrane protein, partial [Muribaculaceae bacterium]|nr:SusF/SusE family outer membrane protein [Muribaculaceae bacterium]
MRLRNIVILSALSVMACSMASCEGEKDLIIITDDLPIKTSTLYMVGNATPTGWDIDNPTPLAPSEADPLVFEWEGALLAGELKLCLQTGSWDVAFIRPVEDQEPISDQPITDRKFSMSAGNPDRKWNVTVAGTYRLSFNLRNWTMSTVCLEAAGTPDTPSVPDDGATPIEAENVYMVGDAPPAGWHIAAPTTLDRT